VRELLPRSAGSLGFQILVLLSIRIGNIVMKHVEVQAGFFSIVFPVRGNGKEFNRLVAFKIVSADAKNAYQHDGLLYGTVAA
jgi:hypothetical protein